MVGRKRKGSILLILSMLMVMLCGFGMIQVEVQAEDEVYEEVPPFEKYTITGNPGEYVLTIYSEYAGDVTSGTDGLLVWLENTCRISKSDIKEIVISDGITIIDDYAFDGFSELTTVTIPNNTESVKVNKAKQTIKVGKTKKIKASVKLEEKGKKQISTNHTAHFRYVSSDKSVATVSKNGKIKAVGKGKCNVYVYGKNGCGKKIKVTVK